MYFKKLILFNSILFEYILIFTFLKNKKLVTIEHALIHTLEL